MEDSGSSPSGVTGEPVDITGLSFTATYDDGTTGSVIPSSYTPTSFGDTAGTQTVTFSFEGTDITVDVDYDVEAASEPVLESLSVSGSFTNPQYAGWNVDMTGLTFTAHYDDSSSKQVFNVATTPLMWDASGNPNNLGTQDVIFSFTEGDVTVSTGINGTVIHRPDEQDIVTGSENWAYYDYLNEWGLVKSPMEVLQGGASEGDYICGFFTESDYENHTTITPEVLMGYMGTYSVMAGEGYPDGTINTAGYVPTTGLPDLTGLSLNEKYICFGVQASSATTGTFKVVVAPAASNISAGSFSSSDFDTSDANAKVYTVNIISAP